FRGHWRRGRPGKSGLPACQAPRGPAARVRQSHPHLRAPARTLSPLSARSLSQTLAWLLDEVCVGSHGPHAHSHTWSGVRYALISPASSGVFTFVITSPAEDQSDDSLL